MSPTQAIPVQIADASTGKLSPCQDLVVTEDPLTIEVEYGPEFERRREIFATTMRTPGNDLELAIGLLFSEGVISGPKDVFFAKEMCPGCDEDRGISRVLIALPPGKVFNPQDHQRNLLISSSCGICGKIDLSKIQKLKDQKTPNRHSKAICNTEHESHYLAQLSQSVREKQILFKHTGSVHAAALFDPHGNILSVREDVGRHNAMDKLIGGLVYQPNLLSQVSGVFFSGRTSYELIQKSIVAGISLVVSVGAPSSLAISLAEAGGITLAGFLKPNRYNIYTHSERIKQPAP